MAGSWSRRLLKIRAKRGLSRAVQAVAAPTSAAGVRCLTYHSIVPDARDDPEQLTTPLGLFDEQIAFLAANGYYVEAASQVVARLARGESPAPKTVTLAFDDGFADSYHLALPVLEKYRFPATVFLVTAALDGERAPAPGFRDGEWLTWAQAREMQAGGLIDFGCHSATHRKLRGLGAEALRAETEGAKRRLENGLGRAVELFAYPFGSYGSWDAAARRAVERAGFLGAFTTVFGVNTPSTDRFLLRRSRISWCDEIPEFARMLRGAYDWYAFAQLLQATGVRLSRDRVRVAGRVSR